MNQFISVLIIAAFLGAIYLVSPILLPFIVGMAVAYFLNPVVVKLNTYGVPRSVASFAPVLLFFLAILGIFMIAIPMVADDITTFVGRVPIYVAWLEDAVGEQGVITIKLLEHGIHVESIISPQNIMNYSDQLAHFTLNTLKKFVLSAMALGEVISLLIITPLVVFYLLNDWPSFVEKVKSLVPAKQRNRVFKVWADMDSVLAKFLRGQVVVCTLLGLFYGTCLAALGLEMGFIIGFVTGLLSFIPYVGMLVGLTIAGAVACMQYQFNDMTQYGLVAGVFVVGQLLEGFVLTPRLVGKEVGLHPVWVIFAVMAGGQIGGFLGVLLALPVAAIATVTLPLVLNTWHKSTK